MQKVLLYNTLSRKKEEFRPISDGTVGLYTCGPTVYSYAHLGNMIPYIDWDILKRVLVHDGYKVRHVMNITDVGELTDADFGEDKVRSAALKEHKTVREVVEFYKEHFLEDERRLNIIPPDVVRNASEEIEGILKLIGVLDEKGYLYRLDDGIYFDTSKFKGYGALTGMDFETLKSSIKAGARVERPEGLRNPTDFAVWRLARPGDKEMVWDSKYGRGFPGWHIECSEISMKFLGSHFDIHCGGVDHIQVHHSNEIAQSESITGEKFVNYWVHNNHMTVDGRKMSKSLGNVYTLQDVVDRGFSPMAYRYLVVSSHYRSSLNFTFEAIENAENTLKHVRSVMEDMAAVEREGEPDSAFCDRVIALKGSFYAKLDDDLGTPGALSDFHEIVGMSAARLGEDGMSSGEARLALGALLEMDSGILGLGLDSAVQRLVIPDEARKLIAEREKFRERGDFGAADSIRERLRKEFGIELVDTKKGVRAKRAV